ncbi:MAG: hypothetical protein PHD76_13930 [Methylacidiphilales bacterium]|nr:hypothetical protein [Candidatus Methylacidiphilales bacterium]
MVLRENTKLDPRVALVARRALRTLKRSGIPHALTGGALLNLLGVGRPTFDVDIIVSRAQWQKAVDLLKRHSIDNERMGLSGEPEPAAILKTREGPYLEIFPEGLTAGEIAKLRGYYRAHRAGKIAFRVKGNPLVNLINSKLASYLSARDRLQDLSDVQRLIKHQELSLGFELKLDSRVRKTFRDLLKRTQPVKATPGKRVRSRS